MPIRRSGRHNSYWVVLLHHVTVSPLRKYHLIHVNSSRMSIDELMSTFPQASVCKIPAYMNNVLAAVSSNTVRSSFCSENLLDCIGNMVQRQRHCYNHLLNLFDSKQSFIMYCIEVVSCQYIAKALQFWNMIRKILSREDYQLILNQCKVVSIEKQAKRHSEEIYLGKCSFSVELV